MVDVINCKKAYNSNLEKNTKHTAELESIKLI